MQANYLISEEKIVGKIYLIRGKKVMLDRDLAEMYGVKTKVLNQAVKRNLQRFPDDFMFRLTRKEAVNLRSQFVTSSVESSDLEMNDENLQSQWGGMRTLPYAFTEQGVAMLSSVLSSQTAIDVNIQIIRVFTRMREMLISHKDILLKLEAMEKTLMEQGNYISRHEEEMQAIFTALKQLLDPERPPMEKVGYRRKDERSF